MPLADAYSALDRLDELPPDKMAAELRKVAKSMPGNAPPSRNRPNGKAADMMGLGFRTTAARGQSVIGYGRPVLSSRWVSSGMPSAWKMRRVQVVRAARQVAREGAEAVGAAVDLAAADAAAGQDAPSSSRDSDRGRRRR